MKRKIIYLDFDGVLNPYLAKNPSKHWQDYRKQQLHVDFDPGGISPPKPVKVWYSLELGEALNMLTTEDGIEIVWASTWCFNDQANKLLSPMMKLPKLRTLPFNPWHDREWRTCGKGGVVYADVMEEDTHFVWIDDDMGQRDFALVEHINSTTDNLGHCIKPNPAVGITVTDIEFIRDYFSGKEQEEQ